MRNQESDKKDNNSIVPDASIINERFIIDTIMENTQDTFYFKDKESRFLFISKNVATRLGIVDPDYVIGKTDFDLFQDPHATEAYRDEQYIIRTGKPILGKIEMERWMDGSTAWVLTSKYPLFDRDGQIIGTWGVSRNITELKRAEEELERLNQELLEANQLLEELSITDSLSGLYNHRYFYEVVQKEFARRERNNAADCAIVLMDIDNFKGLNDTLGHLAGDFAIRHVASLLKDNIRKLDYAFRYGGDEFIILFIDTDIAGAQKAAEKLLKVVAATPVPLESKKTRVTISGGAAVLSEAKDANELMNIADLRLYKSKKTGRNRITYSL
ncbi:MAG TPA: GGDEF domain-containing protein [Clostridia bacterium]|nr:GGDEF domain-containing protein [Clostridia bacterium]